MHVSVAKAPCSGTEMFCMLWCSRVHRRCNLHDRFKGLKFKLFKAAVKFFFLVYVGSMTVFRNYTGFS